VRGAKATPLLCIPRLLSKEKKLDFGRIKNKSGFLLSFSTKKRGKAAQAQGLQINLFRAYSNLVKKAVSNSISKR
jgi:hypothetical protein